MYDVGPWMLGEIIAFFPVNCCVSVFFNLIVYLMSGLRLDIGKYAAVLSLSRARFHPLFCST